MRGEKNIPSIEIGSQGEKASDFAVSPAAASSGFTYPSLSLPPSIMRSLCFAKTYVFSSLNLYSFSLYPQLSLWLIARIEVSLSNRGAQNCAEHVILEESSCSTSRGKITSLRTAKMSLCTQFTNTTTPFLWQASARSDLICYLLSTLNLYKCNGFQVFPSCWLCS